MTLLYCRGADNMANSYIIMQRTETGEEFRCNDCPGFASAEAANQFIEDNLLKDQYPESTFSVQPAVAIGWF